MPTPDAAALLRRGLLLEGLTLAWNVVGVILLALAAWRSRSLALAGFGFDSLIEIAASTVVIWQLRGAGRAREAPALRVIAASFVLLVVFILAEAGVLVLRGVRPAPSLLGLLWLALTVAAMLALAWGKRATGRALDNQVLISEAGVTLVDAGLAGAVLAGVGCNALFGWWWADPLSSLAVVAYAVREAREAWTHAKKASAG